MKRSPATTSTTRWSGPRPAADLAERVELLTAPPQADDECRKRLARLANGAGALLSFLTTIPPLLT